MEILLNMQIPSQTSGFEPEFQADGKIVYLAETRRSSGAEQIKHSRHFVVARKGRQWKIRTTNLNEDKVVNGIKYDEAGCDGTKLLELKQFHENNPKISNVKNITTAHGRIRYGSTLAVFDTDFTYTLWLAYCSSDRFLSSENNRLAAPLFIMSNSLGGDVPPVLLLPAKWKFNNSHFVSEIAWYSEGKELDVLENGTSRLQTLRPPFDSGFLRASFETTDWVQFSGMLVPGGFALKVFFPNWTTGKLDVSYTIDAKVQAINPLRNFSFLPELTKKTRITDTRYRFCSPCSGHPTYAGLAWMTEEEVEAKNKSLGIKYEKQTAQN